MTLPASRSIADRVQILDLLNTWADVIDRGKWSAYESLYTPGASIDFSAIGSTGSDPSSHRDFLERVAAPATRSQQHLLGNTIFLELGDDQAKTRTACHASVVMVDGSFVTIAVWYVDELRKVNGTWLISHRVCEKNFVNPDEWVNPAQMDS